MKNKNLVIIMCHCDNDIKKKTLNKNIDKIKSEGFDIMVLSHIPVSNTYKIKLIILYMIKATQQLHTLIGEWYFGET